MSRVTRTSGKGYRHNRRSRPQHQPDLFGSGLSNDATGAPAWPELPAEARAALTSLMTRLILDHAATTATPCGKEADFRVRAALADAGHGAGSRHRDAHAGPHPSDPDLPQRIACSIAVVAQINHPLRPSRFPGKRPIEFVSSVLLSRPLQARVEPRARIADRARA